MITKELRKNKGITLIVLVITIIILLILAGITIGAITGDNGIIKNAESAKEETEIANEKEIIEKATVQAMGNNKYGNIEKSELQSELDKETGEGKTEVSSLEKEFEVAFIDSKRYYTVDIDGNIVGEGKIVEDKSPGDITKDENGKTLKGDETEPYEIWCIEDLVEVSRMFSEDKNNFYGKTINLMTNLNFASKYSYADYTTRKYDIFLGGDGNTGLMEQLSSNGLGFKPIGNNSGDTFWGDFDGKEHEIKNIYIAKESYAGLFAAVGHPTHKSVIKDLSVTGKIDSNDQGGYVGGIIAYARSAKVENCHSKVEINAKDYSVGGIIGTCQYQSTDVVDCSNEGNIENASSGTGGIIGVIQGGIQVNIINSYNEANIKDNREVGGLVGINVGTLNIYNCHQMGSVEGGNIVGGIVGHILNNNIKLRNVYNIGKVVSNSSKGSIGIFKTDNLTIDADNVYYKKEEEITGIYNKEDEDYHINGYYENEWDSNVIMEYLNQGIETKEEEIDKTIWKHWIIGNDGYPTLDFTT